MDVKNGWLSKYPQHFSLLLLICFFFYRWISSYAGYPSSGWDFGAHFSIIEELKHGNFFPEFGSTQLNENSISQYMPIYSGILGSHLLTLLLHTLFGLTITKSMLILSDLATVASFAALYRICKANGCSRDHMALVFVLQTLFTVSCYVSGFYAQSLGLAVGYWAFVASEGTGRNLLLLCSAVIYPDILLWLLPAKIYSCWKKTNIFTNLLTIPLIAIFLGLLAVLASRIKLNGSAEVMWVGYLLLLYLFIFSRKNWPQGIRLRIYPYVFISSLLLCISYARFDRFTYYSRKPLFWVPLFLALTIHNLKSKFILSIVFLSIVGAVIWDKDVLLNDFIPVISGHGIFNSDQEANIRTVIARKNCANGIFLADQATASPTQFQILNSITGRNNVATMSLRLDDLNSDLTLALKSVVTTSPQKTQIVSAKLPQAIQVMEGWRLYCP